MGEVFRSPREVWNNWPYHDLPTWYGRRLASYIRTDPTGFLERRIYGDQEGHVAAAGFRIFYSQAQEGSWRAVWPYLRSLSDLRVIHLKRTNILRVQLSLARAKQTGRWLAYSPHAARDDDEARPPIPLDVAECRRAFAETRKAEAEYARYFGDHEMIQVFYEQLVADLSGEMRRIQALLQVPYEPVQPRTHKIEEQALSEAIENYAELKLEFENTPWAGLFED